MGVQWRGGIFHGVFLMERMCLKKLGNKQYMCGIHYESDQDTGTKAIIILPTVKVVTIEED